MVQTHFIKSEKKTQRKLRSVFSLSLTIVCSKKTYLYFVCMVSVTVGSWVLCTNWTTIPIL